MLQNAEKFKGVNTARHCTYKCRKSCWLSEDSLISDLGCMLLPVEPQERRELQRLPHKPQC